MKNLNAKSKSGISKKIMIIALITASVLLIGSCAAGPNPNKNISVEQDGKPAGFFLGLWHGFISLFTFIGSLFSSKVNIYETFNNGGWYNFGFILGASVFFGGSGGAGGKARKRRKMDE